MFADPQSVTINSVAISMPRVGIDTVKGTFAANDALHTLTIGQSKGRNRNRRMIRIDERKIAADPFNAELAQEYRVGAYLVVDVPVLGYTVAEQKLVVDGFLAYLTASSGAKITQLLGGEL